MTRAPYRYAFAAIVLALAAACSGEKHALTIDVEIDGKSEAALNEAMQADRDFAAMAQKDGVGAAFVQYMDAVDGRMIQPGQVVQGPDQIRAAFAGWQPNAQLVWSPDGGHASKSGDLAVTTGRFESKVDGVVRGAGRYVTVWRKNDKGEWKGLLDLGVPDPPPPAPPRDPDPEGRPG